MADHILDVLSICHYIVSIRRYAIVWVEFEEETPQMTPLQAILAERHDMCCNIGSRGVTRVSDISSSEILLFIF